MFLDELARVLRLNVPADEKIKLAQAETEKIKVAEEELERQRLSILHKRYEGVEERGVPLQWFSPDEEIDLSVARTNKLIWDRPAKGIFIRYLDRGIWNNTKIRFDNLAAPMFPIMTGYMKMSFNKIYLTNTAQAGKAFVFVIGYQDRAEYRMLDIPLYNLRDDICGSTNKSLEDIWDQAKWLPKVTEDLTHYSVTMTLADTEYSQVLPDYTLSLRIRCRDGTALRYAFVTGKVAASTEPFGSIETNGTYLRENLSLMGKTLYLACAGAGKIVELEIGIHPS